MIYLPPVESSPTTSLIDTLRACLTAMAKASGFTQTEILDQACDPKRCTEMSSLLWQLIEEFSGASVEEIARLFGMPEGVISDGLIKLHDDLFVRALRTEIKKQITLQEIARFSNPEADRWKVRAYRAERELANVRRIAKDGGSWEAIAAYLDEI